MLSTVRNCLRKIWVLETMILSPILETLFEIYRKELKIDKLDSTFIKFLKFASH